MVPCSLQGRAAITSATPAALRPAARARTSASCLAAAWPAVHSACRRAWPPRAPPAVALGRRVLRPSSRLARRGRSFPPRRTVVGQPRPLLSAAPRRGRPAVAVPLSTAGAIGRPDLARPPPLRPWSSPSWPSLPAWRRGREAMGREEGSRPPWCIRLALAGRHGARAGRRAARRVGHPCRPPARPSPRSLTARHREGSGVAGGGGAPPLEDGRRPQQGRGRVGERGGRE
ncbi:hypothetical protein PVAP13_1NG386819 [Panicum virgatum]|uniref:Uncharacterized protein n=1 Tax=Panicum virgatum TaxID=38727 RepID=A0A8T0X1I8_PANVG|nr:hypothetical protein PVAP13_1NG386819 [Panicum virgatum]